MSRTPITALVALHFAIVAVHGSAHTTLAVGLPPAKNAFVLVVIIVAPLVAAALVWTRYAIAGVWLFFVSILGAFLFGAYHHFVMVSPDHIGHLPSGDAGVQSRFILTAIGLALVELVSTVYGAFALRKYVTATRTTSA
jgi:hypothetical protein